MLGAIAGDIIGSVYEGKAAWQSARTPHFRPLFHPKCRFTDDTVLTVAVADGILRGGDLVDLFKDYARRYPGAGYGGAFRLWAASNDREPYQSWGNGSAMRVSPVGFAYDSLAEVLLRAKGTAEVTHDHPEGIKGAQATAAAIYLTRTGVGKPALRTLVTKRYGYDLSRTLDEIRPTYQRDETCQKTVPEAITAFLESDGFEQAIRNAVSLGGDSDTLAAIAGSIAEAAYGVPDAIKGEAMTRLDPQLRAVVGRFYERLGNAS